MAIETVEGVLIGLLGTAAVAVFASDAISSTAYASEEILLVLVPVATMVVLEDLVGSGKDHVPLARARLVLVLRCGAAVSATWFTGGGLGAGPQRLRRIET